MAEDALEEILHFLPEKEQRVLGRSIAKRYHKQTEPLLIEEVMRKPITNKELESYCLGTDHYPLVLQVTGSYMENETLTTIQEHCLLDIGSEGVKGICRFNINANGAFYIQHLALEIKNTSSLVSDGLAIFKDLYPAQEMDITVVPDAKALKWIYTQRLLFLELDPAPACCVLRSQSSPGREALYWRSQHLANPRITNNEFWPLFLKSLGTGRPFAELAQELKESFLAAEPDFKYPS